MECHICSADTDFNCDRCNKPVCEDCCIKLDAYNQIDYPLCVECAENSARQRWDEDDREHKNRMDIQALKKIKRDKRRANYYKPENIEKRRLRKIERRKKQEELKRGKNAKIMDIIDNMFKGIR